MKCRNCGEKMKEIYPVIYTPTFADKLRKGTEYSCDNCGQYRNAKGQWRSNS